MSDVLDLSQARWRGASSVHRKYMLYELYAGDTMIMDIGFTNRGVLEVFLGSDVTKQSLEWDTLLAKIEEGKALAEIERIEADKREADWPPEWRTPLDP